MTRLRVRVTARAARDSVAGFDAAGVLHVRVSAAPVDGAANEALGALLAEALGLSRRDVALVAGARSREKAFEVPVAEAELRARLPARKERHR